MDDRKRLLSDLADVALQVWAVTKALSEEPKPNWAGIGRSVEDHAKQLSKLAEEIKSRG